MRVLSLDNLVGLKVPTKVIKQVLAQTAMLANLEVLSLRRADVEKV